MTYIEKAELSVPVQKKSLIINNSLKAMIEAKGKVTPQMIVDEAENAKSPLHKFFEWDNSAAAQKYRLMQATNMILSSKFVCMLGEKKPGSPIVDGKGHMVRKLLPAYDGAHGFKDRVEVLDDKEARKSIIDRKIAVLRSWCESVVDILELEKTRNGILRLISV